MGKGIAIQVKHKTNTGKPEYHPAFLKKQKRFLL